MRIKNYNKLYQLTFAPYIFPVNVYVYEEEQTLTLIDTGIKPMVKPILAFSKKLGKPITRILLTHTHDDHIGGLLELKRVLPDAKVYVSLRESRFLKADFTFDPGEANFPLKGGYPKKPLEVSFDTFVEGDTFGSLKAVAVPGHTPGLHAFWEETDRILIAGDALQTRGGLAVAGKMNLTFPFPALATWSKALAVASAEKILALNPSVIGVGHGELLNNPREALSAAIKAAKQNLY